MGRTSAHAPLFSAGPVPPALTPDLALAYVRELSADVRAVAVLDAEGALLAGDGAVAAAAAPLLAAGAEAEAVTAGGVVCTARDDRHAIVAACGRLALAGLRGDAPGTPPALAETDRGTALGTAAEAAISAVQRAPEA